MKFGEPNIWSLDQAHYLLEQRFQKNQTLEATRPSADDLNANSMNGTRMSSLRQMFQASGGFDQGLGLNNEFARRRIEEDAALRPERRRLVDESLRRQAELAAKIQAIAEDPANYIQVATTTPPSRDLSPEAKAKTAALNVQMEAEKRVADTYKAALTDTVPTQLKSFDSFEGTKALAGAALETFKDKFSFGDPRLSASNAVDNFVNLQNEMIMKQVTLLRNEAGYNRRIIFAELPQAFDVDGSRWYAKRPENKLVQVQWKLAGYLYVPRDNLQKLRRMDNGLVSAFLRRQILDVCDEKSTCPRVGKSGELQRDELLRRAVKEIAESEAALQKQVDSINRNIADGVSARPDWEQERARRAEELRNLEADNGYKDALVKRQLAVRGRQAKQDELTRERNKAKRNAIQKAIDKGTVDVNAAENHPALQEHKRLVHEMARSEGEIKSIDEKLAGLRRKLGDLQAKLVIAHTATEQAKERLRDRDQRKYPDDKNARQTLEELRKHTRFAEMSESVTGDTVSVPNGTLRAIDLVPRVSSLNLNDRHYASTYFGLFGIFRFLSGFGVNASYQRQKEQFEQYINQEIFATSYGKGSSEFGWTFGPNPGTPYVAPGQRTTYAIFSIPSNTLAVVLRARSCVYDRRDEVPRTPEEQKEKCEEWEDFPLAVPGEFESGFWIDEIRYAPAPAGGRVVAYLSGEHFSTLTGVTINGVPLKRAVSLAASNPSSGPVAEGSVDGEYEVITPDKIVLSFRMSPGYVGTPVIGLITPVKARFINDLKLTLRVAGQKFDGPLPLADPVVFPMFYPKPEIRSVRWENSGQLVVEGSNLVRQVDSSGLAWGRYYLNGEITPLVHQPLGPDDAWTDRLVLQAPSSGIQSDRIDLRFEFEEKLGIPAVRFVAPNPLGLSISKSVVLKHKDPQTLVELQGLGFGPNLTAEVRYATQPKRKVDLYFVSSERLLVPLTALKNEEGSLFAIVTVQDTAGKVANGYVELPPTEPKKEETDEVAETTNSTTVKKVPKKKP